MKKLYWHNLIIFGLLVLVPQVFDYVYEQKYYGERIITAQYITSFLLLFSGILLIYKNIKFFYSKKENNIKIKTLHKVVVSLLVFLSTILILIGLFSLTMQYGLRHGVGL